MRDVQPNLAPFVSGVIAGGMATLVLHPLDLIKIRFQGIYISLVYPYYSHMLALASA